MRRARLPVSCPGRSRRFSTATGVAHRDPYLPVPLTKRAVEQDAVLVRDFIFDSLYNPAYGYFAQKHTVFSAQAAIDFPKLKDKDEYLSILKKYYEQDESSWMTPAEVFKPHYGAAVSSYLRRNHRAGEPLNIFEMGGGNGTTALSILDDIKAKDPVLYANTFYTIVEVSARLAERCRSTLGGKHLNCTVVNKSILDWRDTVEEECFFLGFEVLDNLPHDKVMTWQGKQYACYVRKGFNRLLEPVFFEHPKPVTDPFMLRCLEQLQGRSLAERTEGADVKSALRAALSMSLAAVAREDEWLPTGAIQLLDVLNTHFPKHSLMLADFDHLPTRIPGYCAPLVQSKLKGGVTRELGTYLAEEGSCDIFFPTDFTFLRRLYAMAVKRPAVVVKQRAFLRQYADLPATTTQSGYNPLMEEYPNMSMFLSLYAERAKPTTAQ